MSQLPFLEEIYDFDTEKLSEALQHINCALQEKNVVPEGYESIEKFQRKALKLKEFIELELEERQKMDDMINFFVNAKEPEDDYKNEKAKVEETKGKVSTSNLNYENSLDGNHNESTRGTIASSSASQSRSIGPTTPKRLNNPFFAQEEEKISTQSTNSHIEEDHRDVIGEENKRKKIMNKKDLFAFMKEKQSKTKETGANTSYTFTVGKSTVPKPKAPAKKVKKEESQVDTPTNKQEIARKSTIRTKSLADPAAKRRVMSAKNLRKDVPPNNKEQASNKVVNTQASRDKLPPLSKGKLEAKVVKKEMKKEEEKDLKFPDISRKSSNALTSLAETNESQKESIKTGESQENNAYVNTAPGEIATRESIREDNKKEDLSIESTQYDSSVVPKNIELEHSKKELANVNANNSSNELTVPHNYHEKPIEKDLDTKTKTEAEGSSAISHELTTLHKPKNHIGETSSLYHKTFEESSNKISVITKDNPSTTDISQLSSVDEQSVLATPIIDEANLINGFSVQPSNQLSEEENNGDEEEEEDVNRPAEDQVTEKEEKTLLPNKSEISIADNDDEENLNKVKVNISKMVVMQPQSTLNKYEATKENTNERAEGALVKEKKEVKIKTVDDIIHEFLIEEKEKEEKIKQLKDKKVGSNAKEETTEGTPVSKQTKKESTPSNKQDVTNSDKKVGKKPIAKKRAIAKGPAAGISKPIEETHYVDYSKYYKSFNEIFAGFILEPRHFDVSFCLRDARNVYSMFTSLLGKNSILSKIQFDTAPTEKSYYDYSTFNPYLLTKKNLNEKELEQKARDNEQLLVAMNQAQLREKLKALKEGDGVAAVSAENSLKLSSLIDLERDPTLYYRVVKNRSEVYDIVSRSFSRKRRWQELPHGLDLKNSWNLLWTWSKIKMDLSRLLVWQKCNHFPGVKNISRKDYLKKNIERIQKMNQKLASVFNISHKTFVLPQEYLAFVEEFTNDEVTEKESNIWIMKPCAKSRGRGISLVNDIGGVSYGEPVVIQKYLKNPLLISGFKFDLRIYVLVTSFNPLEVFLYKEGFARFSTVPYNLNPSDLKNNFIHLTNVSIQKHSHTSASGNGNTAESVFGGTKISLKALKKRFDLMGVNYEKIWQQVIDIVLKALIACQNDIPYHPSCFELFGYDIIIDENQKCWLIEVNTSPSLARDTLLDDIVKQALVDETIDLVNPLDFDRKRMAEVLERRISEESKMASNSSLGSLKKMMNRDLTYILNGQEPRLYGDMPQFMGNYERIAPSALSDKLIKMVGGQKMFGVGPKTVNF